MKSCDHSEMEMLETANDHPPTGETSESGRSRLVREAYPASRLQSMTFSLRYLHKNILSSEEKCVEWLATYGLLKNERICPRCQEASYLIDNDRRWQCGVCHRSISIFHDSVFKHSKLGTRIIIELLYWWSLSGKHTVVSKELECSRGFVCKWFSRCRTICVSYFERHPLSLGGPGQYVEVDLRPLTMASDRLWLLIVVERDSYKTLLRIVPSRKAEATADIVEGVVELGTRVVSRLSDSYRKLCDNPGLLFVHPDDVNVSMDASEEVWLDFKESMNWNLINDYRWSDYYLKEFQFRRLLGDRTFSECLYQAHFCRSILNC